MIRGGEDSTAEGVMEITLAEIALTAVMVVGYLIGDWRDARAAERVERELEEEHRAWRQRRGRDG